MALRGTERFVAQNRRARHDYLIEDTYEAGIALTGSEVKVLREGKASIAEAFGGALQSRAEAGAAAPSAQTRDKQIAGRGDARRHDADSARDLFQSARPRQASARPRQGQAQIGQARGRKGARLAARQGPHHARAPITVAAISGCGR